MKKIFFFAFSLLLGWQIVSAENNNSCYFVDASRGFFINGSTIVMSRVEMDDDPMVMSVKADDIRVSLNSSFTVSLKNSVEVNGYQFDISLPEGISLTKNSNGDYECSLTTRYTKLYNIRTVITKLPSGIFRVLCYSLTNEQINPGEGPIITFPIIADEHMAAGSYECSLSNIYCSVNDGRSLHLDDCVFPLEVMPFLMGDANGDGSINVTDVMLIVNHILGNTLPVFVEECANVNGDARIDVADVMLLVNMILNSSNNVPSVALPATSVLEAVPTSANKVELRMGNMSQYTAFQMQIQMPANVHLLGAEMAEKTTGHRVMTNEIGDGLYNVIVYSLNGERFKETSNGTLLRLLTDGRAKDLEIKNIQFTNKSFETVTFSDVTGTTGIEDVSSDETDADFYNLQGMPVKSPDHGIFIKNGEKMIMQ